MASAVYKIATPNSINPNEVNSDEVWGIKKWQEVSKVCMVVSLALIAAAAICLATSSLSLDSAGAMIGVGFIVAGLGLLKMPASIAKNIADFTEKLDKKLEVAEDIARVPEGFAIVGKVCSAPDSSISSIADSLGAFRSACGILRTPLLATKLATGQTFQGNVVDLTFNILLSITRALSFTSFLHRHRAIQLPKAHAEGIGIGIFAGFTTLGILSFINTFRIWTDTKTNCDENYRIRCHQLRQQYATYGTRKTELDIHNEVTAEMNAEFHELGKQGRQTISEFLEALISPLDTGACSSYATPYLVLPLAILGSISAAIRLWMGHANTGPRAHPDRINLPSARIESTS